jgi:NTP pyrophosphatase (non-canonical NTP hydrolase)
MTQVLATGEEAGEFLGAYRRWIGAARRVGTFEEMAEEVADVVIAAHVACHYLGIDIEEAVARKAEKIFSRWWKEGVPND